MGSVLTPSHIGHVMSVLDPGGATVRAAFPKNKFVQKYVDPLRHTGIANLPQIGSSTPKMPFMDDEAIQRAKKRAIAAQMGGGRASTVLTDKSDTLG